MKFEDASKFDHIANDMKRIKGYHKEILAGGVLGVTLQGTYQPESFVAKLRPAVATILQELYQAHVDRLTELGVTDIPEF